jgi:CRP/FNR family cyclic AMP-dependent transcriptional regulator
MRPEADLLKEVPLFQFLDDHERAALAEKLTVVGFKAGEEVLRVNEPGDALYVVRSGAVEVYVKNDTGERIVFELLKCGDFFGEISLLDGGARSASVVATEDTETLRLDRCELEGFLRSNPHASMDLLAAMGRRLRFAAERLRHTASRNVNEETEDHRTVVQKSADWIAEFSGSIPFLLLHVVFFALWLGLNIVHVPGIPTFDPYPFGFLTLMVSLEAIFLSVFVLLSQNRQVAKDRVRSDIEYEVNLKAELEVAHLHEKMDRLTADVLTRLERLQNPLVSEPVARPGLTGVSDK